MFFNNDLLDSINLVIIGVCLLLFFYRFLFLISVFVCCIFARVLLPPFVLFIWPWLVCTASSCPSFCFIVLWIFCPHTRCNVMSHGLPGFLEGFICPVSFRHLYEVWVVGVLVGGSCCVFQVMGFMELPLIGSF